VSFGAVTPASLVARLMAVVVRLARRLLLLVGLIGTVFWLTIF